jgi:hypothetical protein
VALVGASRRADFALGVTPALLRCHSPDDELALSNLLTDFFELLLSPLLLA